MKNDEEMKNLLALIRIVMVSIGFPNAVIQEDIYELPDYKWYRISGSDVQVKISPKGEVFARFMDTPNRRRTRFEEVLHVFLGVFFKGTKLTVVDQQFNVHYQFQPEAA